MCCHHGKVCGSVPCECAPGDAVAPPDEPAYQTSVEDKNAIKFWEWVNKRGGVAIWHSRDLAAAGATFSTPAKQADGTDMGKPGWQFGNSPDHVVTDPARIEVYHATPIVSIRISVQRGTGMSLVLTEKSAERLRVALQAAGEGAYHVFDESDGHRVALIRLPKTLGSLADYAKAQGWEGAV